MVTLDDSVARNSPGWGSGPERPASVMILGARLGSTEAVGGGKGTVVFNLACDRVSGGNVAQEFTRALSSLFATR